jgi:hypothetical protein
MTQERDPAVKIENIDIQATIEKPQILVREDKQLSAATKSIVEIKLISIGEDLDKKTVCSPRSAHLSIFPVESI